jgi:hypothetical protein
MIGFVPTYAFPMRDMLMMQDKHFQVFSSQKWEDKDWTRQPWSMHPFFRQWSSFLFYFISSLNP